MRRISVKGVLLGGIVDIVATNIAMIPLVMVAMTRLDLARLPEVQQTAAFMEALNASPALFTTGLLLGSACSILGGYVAARIAKRAELLNGALSAVLCVGAGLYALAAGGGTVGPAQHLGYLLLSPALGALGGYLRQLQARTPGPDQFTPAPSA